MYDTYVSHPKYTANVDTDIVEQKNQWQVLLDLPGFSKKNVEVKVQAGTLQVLANKPEADKNLQAVNQEWQPRQVEKSFRLSESVDQTAVVAEMENGVLRISLPKKEQFKPRQVTIQ